MRNRQRDARHPVVLGTMVFLSYSAVSQLAFGPTGSTVVRDMTFWSQRAFSTLVLCSALACIASAVIRREPLGAKTERAGMFGCAVALMFYSLNLPASAPSWNTTLAVGYGGTALGCAVRAGLVWRMMIRDRQ
ncbi:putative uncharacterized protein [Mycolicibacterium canariasense]|uniref:Uncharacterized protein n=1 Tax=Mycolicibacterium canariasense TaxID=228230 RepID=A0A117IC24_MYCCR|nr:hypothetical protein [Mycolicibacterium canariasense]MCV7213158.1 hypothetical protein [Mycolicibacterium canariasense]GAS98880.1 putative uncharacterized protein [Mycolicibacterium canariasense]